ncbi:unnamed protein product [Notodromas monacha]|uniref:Transcription initiation factor TFIID subunit 2 n=1 Tax=Notodromas monacha TaxID=399045 RepID=A0A7R9BL61_9CRUS|nr:unnamed protein product [Notodromas monacha]CAG0916730.1 unnamed protein product [Notodromas monacha]
MCGTQKRQIGKSRQRPYKLVHQVVCLTGLNFQRRSIIGCVELTLECVKPYRFICLNAKQCRIYKVCINDTIEAQFQYFDPFLEICDGDDYPRSSEYLKIKHEEVAHDVDADVVKGEVFIPIPPSATSLISPTAAPIRVTVEFSFEQPQGGIQFVVPECEGTLVERAAHMFTYTHWNSARLWFPCIDTFSSPCTWKLEFTVDDGMVAVSNGDLLETVYTPDMRRKTYHYSLDVPTSAPNISLAVGPFEIYVDPNIPEVTHFCLPHLKPLLKFVARFLPAIFEFYEDVLGTPYPYAGFKQVFVDQAYADVMPYATMAIFSTSLLHTSAIIDQTYETRKVLSIAIAHQFFGSFIAIDQWADSWVTYGIANYLHGLYIRKTFGNNVYRRMIQTQLQEVVKYEEQFGGVALDRRVISLVGDVVKVEAAETEDNFYFGTHYAATTSPLYSEIFVKKAHLAVRMLEHRIGQVLLIQVFNKQLALATKREEAATKLSAQAFVRAIYTVTGKDVTTFLEQWVRQGGHARFRGSFVFNRKRNTVELEVRQEAVSARGTMKYVGPLTVAVQELDGTFKHTLQIEGTVAKTDITCHSKSRRHKKKKIPLCTGEEVDMDLSAMDAESPVLWIRLDPEMTVMRRVDMEQPDYMWQYEMRYERDVTAQIESIEYLEKFPTTPTKQALNDIIENDQCYIEVREQAGYCLARVANKMAPSWVGPPAMLAIFRKFFGCKQGSHIVRQNDFASLQHYYLQKAMPKAIGALRNAQGKCPSEVLKFLLDLFKYNDNSKNKFSDNYYRAALVDALEETITPASVTGEKSGDIKLVIDEIVQQLNLEKLLPCYKQTVTVSCLRAIRKLQRCGHLRSEPSFFRSYAAPGQFIDVRLAALECLVDHLKLSGSSEDFSHLLDIVTSDAEPAIRHALVRMLVDKPPFSPFSKAQQHLNTPELAERLWNLINTGMSFDSRLRCDLVDLYYGLYGSSEPDVFKLLSRDPVHAKDESDLDSSQKSFKEELSDEDIKADIKPDIGSISPASSISLRSSRSRSLSPNRVRSPSEVPIKIEPESPNTRSRSPSPSRDISDADTDFSDDFPVKKESLSDESSASDETVERKKHKHRKRHRHRSSSRQHKHKSKKRKKEKKKKHKHKKKHEKHERKPTMESSPPLSSSEKQWLNAFMATYCDFLSNYFYVVIISSIVVTSAMTALAVVYGPSIDFSSPDAGFETRRTPLSKRVQTWRNLEEALKKGRHLSFLPQNVTRISKRDVDQQYSCGDLGPDFARVVVSSKNLFTVSALKEICELESFIASGIGYKQLCLYASETRCCPTWSLSRVVSELRSVNCRNITERDVAFVKDLLTTCLSYYESGKLAVCTRSACQDVPESCKNSAVFNMFYYLMDSKFLRKSSELQHSAVFLPVASSTGTSDVFFESLENAPTFQNFEVTGVEMGLKWWLFEYYLIRDTLFCVSGAIVALFCCLWIYSESFCLSFATMTSGVMSLAIAYFFYVIVFDIRFFPYINLMAIALAIAVVADDSFIVWAAWKSAEDVREALEHSWMPCTVTSLTTAVALYSSYVSSITAVKCFSIFGGTAVLVNLFLTLTWIPAWLIAYEKFFQKKATSCCFRDVFTRAIEHFFKQILKAVLIPLKFVWIGVFGGLAVISVVLVTYWPGLKLPHSNEVQLFDMKHPFEHYVFILKKQFDFEEDEEKFNAAMPMRFVFGVEAVDVGNPLNPDDWGKGMMSLTTNFNISSPEAQVFMLDFCQELRQQGFYLDTPGAMISNCFVESFKNYFMARDCIDTIERVNLWPCCQDSRFPYKPKVFENCALEGIASLRETMEKFENPTDLEFYDLQNSLSSDTFATIGTDMGLAFLILVAVSRSVVVTFFAIITVGSVIFTTVAVLTLFGWTLNILESCVIALAIGLAVDFTLHYGLAFKMSVGERAGEALSAVGAPVAMGAVTTFLAGVTLLPSRVLAHVQIGIFLIVLMTVSWAMSTFLFVPLLALCECNDEKKDVVRSEEVELTVRPAIVPQCHEILGKTTYV